MVFAEKDKQLLVLEKKPLEQKWKL